jgi:hypothetical protein
MNNTLHAPAPWTINRISRWHDGTPQDFDYLEVVSRQGYQLSITNDCKPQSIATANLIAAAPDLLSALQYTLSILTAPDCPQVPDAAFLRGKIVNAIVKAKGEL